MLQTISVLVENKAGALLRVTAVLASRGFNIDSLTVAKTTDPALSRMTITVSAEERVRARIIAQMNKLINVVEAIDLTESPSSVREMVLLRLDSASLCGSLLKTETAVQARLVGPASGGFVMEATGSPTELDAWIATFPEGAGIEVTRSGGVAVPLESRSLPAPNPVRTGQGRIPVGQALSPAFISSR
jgi:acetolactate synthase-1/3 small subunit